MKKNTSTENYGTLIDRTMRVIKLNYLQGFKSIGVDLTTEQWVMIDTLYQNNGISQTDLANGSFKNAPTVSRIVDLLCKKELTERQRFDNDKRRYKIFLTKKGKETYRKVLPVVKKLRKQGWKGLSMNDHENFLRIINQVFSNFEK